MPFTKYCEDDHVRKADTKKGSLHVWKTQGMHIEFSSEAQKAAVT
jgi:hypothetical protein